MVAGARFCSLIEFVGGCHLCDVGRFFFVHPTGLNYGCGGTIGNRVRSQGCYFTHFSLGFVTGIVMG
ncbi:MAG: hypothetical protein DRR19_28815, partial [Candidatus Parabeggiatoa sp. nov. 1]